MVAERFGKEHFNVLVSIDNIRIENSSLTQRISTMFCDSYYQAGTGRRYREILMNRDGFTLLAMGFTGSDALEWKLKYIKAFNDMEAELNKPKAATIPTNFVEALTLALEQAKELEVTRPKAEFVDTYVDKGAWQEVSGNGGVIVSGHMTIQR